MAKASSVFFCQNCGAQSAKWIGRCPSCGEWNTYDEEVVKKDTGRESSMGEIKTRKKTAPVSLDKISTGKEERINTGTIELNRVLGGGLVPGSLVLIGGEPGIGKSTLMLQVALLFDKYKVLYVTGEGCFVRKYSSNGGFLTEWGSCGNGPGQFSPDPKSREPF